MIAQPAVFVQSGRGAGPEGGVPCPMNVSITGQFAEPIISSFMAFTSPAQVSEVYAEATVAFLALRMRTVGSGLRGGMGSCRPASNSTCSFIAHRA